MNTFEMAKVDQKKLARNPIFHAIVKNRIWVILAAILISVGIGSGMEKLQFSSDYRDFFESDNPKLQAFEALQDKFVRSHNVFLAIEAKQFPIFTEQGLHALDELTQELWKLPFVMRVDSVTNHQFVKASDDEISVWEYRNRPIHDEDQAKAFHTLALAEESLNGFLVAKNPALTGINISLSDRATSETGKAEFITALNKVLADIDPELFVFYKSGSIVIDYGFDVAAQADLENLYGIFYLLVLALLFVLTRSPAAVFGVLLTVTMSWMISLGLSAYIGIKLTAISVTAPTVLMTLAVAQCMHVVYSIQKRRAQDTPIKDAVYESLCHNFRPLLLVSLSTALGFVAVMLSEVPPLQDLGFILAVGTVAVFILSITFLPALLSFFSLQAKGYINWAENKSEAVGIRVGKYSEKLLYILAALAFVLVLPATKNEINDNFIEYFDDENTVRQDANFISHNLTGVHHVFFEVEAKEKFGIFEPAYLVYLENLAEWLATQPEVRHVSSLTDVLKRLNKAGAGDADDAYVLPTDKELASQLFLLYEMSLPISLTPRNIVDLNQKSSRITVVLNNISSKEMLALESRVKSWHADQNTQTILHSGTGPTIMFADIGQRNSENVVVTTALALVCISLTLILAFRSVRLGLISLIPNLLPAAIAFGIWGLIDGEVGLATSVVILMTFGIVVDDTIFFLTRYKENFITGNFQETISKTFRQIAVPIFNTSIILTFGFAILAFSNFRLSQGMGILTAMVIFLALICDLFLLPGLIKIFDYRSRRNLP